MSPDKIKPIEKFAAKYGLTFPLASDEDHAVAERYGTWVEKSMYGRKYMGMERSTFLIGRDGKVLKAWRKVSVTGHADDVMKAAQAAKLVLDRPYQPAKGMTRTRSGLLSSSSPALIRRSPPGFRRCGGPQDFARG